MLVTLAAKCVAGLAAGLRKKFGPNAGHVGSSTPDTSWLLLSTKRLVYYILCVCVVGVNHFGEVQGKESSSGSGAAGSDRRRVPFCECFQKYFK